MSGEPMLPHGATFRPVYTQALRATREQQEGWLSEHRRLASDKANANADFSTLAKRVRSTFDLEKLAGAVGLHEDPLGNLARVRDQINASIDLAFDSPTIQRSLVHVGRALEKILDQPKVKAELDFAQTRARLAADLAAELADVPTGAPSVADLDPFGLERVFSTKPGVPTFSDPSLGDGRAIDTRAVQQRRLMPNDWTEADPDGPVDPVPIPHLPIEACSPVGDVVVVDSETPKTWACQCGHTVLNHATRIAGGSSMGPTRYVAQECQDFGDNECICMRFTPRERAVRAWQVAYTQALRDADVELEPRYARGTPEQIARYGVPQVETDQGRRDQQRLNEIMGLHVEPSPTAALVAEVHRREMAREQAAAREMRRWG